MSTPAAFIIDLDGTLVDTLGDFVSVLAHTLGDLGLPPVSADFVSQTVGRGSEHLIRMALAEAGADLGEDPGLYERAWIHYQQHYQRLNGAAAEVFPGVREGLAWLSAQGLPMVCLTNKPTRFAKDLLHRKGLDGHFQLVFGGDSFERKKPDPLPLLKTCEAMGVRPEQAWMIGDSRNDAEAAHAAGCPVVLLRYGYNHGEPIDKVLALAHLDRLDQISEVLASVG